MYIFVRYLQGSSGLINAARAWCWVPIEQYSNSSLTIHFFEHVHNLSLEFHLNRKTGELLRILDRGTSSIVTLVSTVLFQLVPVILDVILAVVLLCVGWSWKYAVIVFITIVSYLIVTIVVTEWRTQFRRAMISFDNEARAKAVDSLLNFETVKYYSAEEFEVSRYRYAIYKYMIADYKSQLTYQMLNLLQSFVITMGMLAGCLLCAYEISQGILKVEYFVAYIMFLNQLYQPVSLLYLQPFLCTFFPWTRSSSLYANQLFVVCLTDPPTSTIVELVRNVLQDAATKLCRHGEDD